MLTSQGSSLSILHNSFDHLIAHARSILQTWGKVALNVFKTVAISLEGTEGYTIRPCLNA